MKRRYRPLKANKDDLRKVITDFVQTQNYEKTYKKLMGGDWGARLPHTKSKQQQINLEKHVSISSCESKIVCGKFQRQNLRFE